MSVTKRGIVISHLRVIRTWAAVATEGLDVGISGWCCADVRDWVDEALELLKEQEPAVAEVKHRGEREYYACGACGAELDCRVDKFCWKCGREAVYRDD